MDRSQTAILVTGATGKQGGAVARHLLADGFHVRAFVRNPQSPAALLLAKQGAELIVGDLDYIASVDTAVDGAHGVFSVQGWVQDGVEAEERRGTALAQAAARAGVEHFVYASVGGAELGTGIPHFESKWHIEQRIHELQLPATIWRPVYFMENLLWQRDAILSGRIAPPLDPEVPIQFIAVEDVGAFVACAFRNPGSWLGHTTEIAGDQCSFIDVANTLSRVLGHEVVVDELVPPPEPERVHMMHWFEEAGYHARIKTLRQILPTLRDLDTWTREAFADVIPG